MGTLWSNDGRYAGKKARGLAVAVPLLEHSGRDDQVDPMVCEPATSGPFNSARVAGGEETFKEPGNCGAPGEKNAGWQPPGTSFTSGMFNNGVDGGVRSDFSNFVSFLQRFPAGGENDFHEHRNFSLAAVVKFLEDRNADVLKAASQQIADLDASYRSEVTMLTGKHEQQVSDCEARAQGKIQELSRDLEKVSNELSDAQVQQRSTRSSLNSAQSELLDSKKAVQTMQAQLAEEVKQKQELSKNKDTIKKDLNAQRVELEVKLRHSVETGHVKDREVHRLNAIIEEKVEAVGNMEAATSQLTSEYQKLKAQLATIEQKSAQESLTSGSYPDDFANPGMLVCACQSVDSATDQLVRFLHNISITSRLSLKTAEVEGLIGLTSTARPADFSRPAQVKHVWGHWICANMFQGFEHVFFDIGRERTSPLDSKKHAAECFQSFQQNKDVAPLEYYKACAMFRAFCIKKYARLFPPKVVHDGLQLDRLQIVSLNRDGRFDGDGDLYLQFLFTAKAIWLLHELSLSFDPPASILRMGPGTPFDKQFHEPLARESENEMNSKVVVLMVKPAFRVRTSIIKSRVFLAKRSP